MVIKFYGIPTPIGIWMKISLTHIFFMSAFKYFKSYPYEPPNSKLNPLLGSTTLAAKGEQKTTQNVQRLSVGA